ncbi:MAG: hypothetical protein NTY09_09105 [bacterium]|nr:hypothetical protein [bacterium]
MRYSLYLAIIAVMLSLILAPQAIADQSKDGFEPPERTGPVERPVEIPAEIEESPVVESPQSSEIIEPQECEKLEPVEEECPPEATPPEIEMSWFSRPWDFWRHMDERSLDYDAIQYMGNVRRIAILPFDDLTTPTIAGQTKLQEAGGPRRLVDNLAAEFMRWGYLVVPPSDAEAYLNTFIQGDSYRRVDSEGNNLFWFQNMPDRAMNFYATSVPGLAEQRMDNNQTNIWLSREDIIYIAQTLEADCVVRGFVNEYAVSRDIDADWRTFIPPFLGLLNPDRRVTMEVAYYLYDGASGELIWNGTVDIQNDANWPMFTSDAELIEQTEGDMAGQVTGHVLPQWMDIAMCHPDWVPFPMWQEGFDGCMGGMGMGMGRPEERPDWVNPYRMGWHNEYLRDDAKVDIEPVENPPARPWFRDLDRSYNGIRLYLGEK